MGFKRSLVRIQSARPFQISGSNNAGTLEWARLLADILGEIEGSAVSVKRLLDLYRPSAYRKGSYAGLLTTGVHGMLLFLNSARDKIREINPNVEVDLHAKLFTSGNAMEIAAPYDVLIDGTDNFPTRYLSNDVCVFLGKPNIYGSIFRFDGRATVFAPHLGGPCYRCLFPEPPPAGEVPTCAEGGVLGVLPGVIGVIQAIKLILGEGAPLLGRLVHFEALDMKFKEYKLRRDPKCPVCGEHPSITEPMIRVRADGFGY